MRKIKWEITHQMKPYSTKTVFLICSEILQKPLMNWHTFVWNGFFYLQRTIEAKWSFVWYTICTDFFFRFVTVHAFDRRIDGQTELSSLDRVCIPCNAVIKWALAYIFQTRRPSYADQTSMITEWTEKCHCRFVQHENKQIEYVRESVFSWN